MDHVRKWLIDSNVVKRIRSSRNQNEKPHFSSSQNARLSSAFTIQSTSNLFLWILAFMLSKESSCHSTLALGSLCIQLLTLSPHQARRIDNLFHRLKMLVRSLYPGSPWRLSYQRYSKISPMDYGQLFKHRSKCYITLMEPCSFETSSLIICLVANFMLIYCSYSSRSLVSWVYVGNALNVSSSTGHSCSAVWFVESCGAILQGNSRLGCGINM